MWFPSVLNALAWPVAVCLIALWFRPAGPTIRAMLREAIARGGWKLAAWGVSVEAPAAAQQQKGEALPAKAIEAPPPSVPTTSPNTLLGMFMAKVENDLDPFPQGDRVPALIYALARTRLSASHEWTYNRIFGSQVSLLKRLNTAKSLTVSDARTIYAETAAQHPDAYARYPFEDWLGWLTNNVLVLRDGDTLTLGQLGLDFLEHLTQAGLSEWRPL